jgi:hypothetical protein
MALQRDRSRINVKGGGLMKIRQIAPAASDSFLDVGYIKDSELGDAFTMVDSINDAGKFIDTNAGAHKVVWKTTLMQSSIDEINLIRTAEGKYFDLYYSCPLANGNVQEFSAAIVKIKPGAVLAFKSATERNIAIEITFLSPGGAFTRTPTAFNVVSGVEYVLTEGASANGAPSDTASTLYTAVK